jgi:hypothetical protein
MTEEAEDTDQNQSAPENTEQKQEDTKAQPEDTNEEQDTGNEENDGPESGDDEAADTASADQEPVKPPSRSQERIRALNDRLKAEAAEKERLIHERAVAQAQLEHLRQQQQAVQSAAERKAEEDRLALLDPSERALYQANNQLRTLEYRLNQMELQRRDDQDRANFHAKAAHDETYAKYADQVEEMYQDGLKRGVSASREDLHSYILGKELKKDLATKVSKKKESAGKRIESVTSKPASARGDVTSSKKGKSEEDRLRGVLI